MAGTIKNVLDVNIKENRGNIRVGDDVTKIVNNYNSRQRKIQFESVTTGLDIFADYPKPSFIDEIFTKARAERVVIVGGNGSFNKGELLKYVAVHLKTEGLEVKECSEFDDFYSLSAAIRQISKRSVLILYNLTATSINFRFTELKTLIRQKDHIILGSTDTPYDSWMFQEGSSNPNWFQIPEDDLYSKAELYTYLKTGLQKKGLKLPGAQEEEIVARLSRPEQVDIFINQMTRQNGQEPAAKVRAALDISTSSEHSDLEPWFNNLSEFNKLVVIGITLFDGAYESQVFAGYERILATCWKRRNKELRSIDYGDLIPLGGYIKTDGKSIQGVYNQQRRKILRMAWKTHKRYLLSAIPELLEIIYDSVNKQKSDLDLFASSGHRYRIRNILSETLSDLSLQSFEDAYPALAIIASHDEIDVQMVTAASISRWKRFDEERIFEILDMLQEDIDDILVEYTSETNTKENAKEGARVVSNLRGTIALALCFASYYEEVNTVSAKIIDHLVELLPNVQAVFVHRMQFAVENITARHPKVMEPYLKNEFLQYPSYIAPIAKGLIAAYYNGQADAVKTILLGWLDWHRKTKPTPEEREKFGHHEGVLSAVICTLQYIDYNPEDTTITIAEAFGILEELRKTNHNIHIRKFVLDAIVQLIEDMFNSKELIPIRLISNIDAKEREEMVKRFKEKYLNQRKDLKGGDYYIESPEYVLDTWSNPDARPDTAVEKMLTEWKTGSNNLLSQIALESFIEFQDFEAMEKRLVETYKKEKTREEKEMEKKRQEYEKKGAPIYEGEIQGGIETEAFVKLCAPFVDPGKLPLLRNIYSVAVYKNLDQEGTDEFISHLDETDTAMVKKVAFIYRLFRNENFQLNDNPARSSFQSTLFVVLAGPKVPFHKKQLLRGFAPLMLSVTHLTVEERNVVFNKINPYKRAWLRNSLFLARNPVVFLILCFAILILFVKLLQLIF